MNNWNIITKEEDVQNLIEKSKEFPQIIFKDSTSCGISAHAKSRLVEGNKELTENADVNYLDLLQYRQISNYIADTFDVIHQSPQIIVLWNGEVIYTVTHHAIQTDKIVNNIKSKI